MAVKARGLAAALAAFLVAPRPASAHPEFSALGTNRYVTVAVVDGRVEVTDGRLEGILTGGDDRRRFDADGDGRVSPGELSAARTRLDAEGPDVALTIDGRPLAGPVETSIELGDEPRAVGAPLVVERRQSFPGVLPAGPHSLRVTVTREPPKLLDTELGLVLAPGAALREGPDRVTFHGPRASTLETRAATFVLEAGAPRRPARRAPVFLLALAAMAALGAAAVARRRRSTR